MYDLFQNYVTDLNKFRDAFHNELTATAEELSKAMAFYASRSDAALASFMEKATARGEELEAAAAARLNQFRGLSAIADLSGADNGRVARTPTNPDRLKSQPPQSGRSRTFCNSRARGIVSRRQPGR